METRASGQHQGGPTLEGYLLQTRGPSPLEAQQSQTQNTQFCKIKAVYWQGAKQSDIVSWCLKFEAPEGF